MVVTTTTTKQGFSWDKLSRYTAHVTHLFLLFPYIGITLNVII